MGTKRNKTQERINELMEHIPKLPKDFNTWAMTKTMPDSKYIFYKKKGRKFQGVCSSCGSRVEVDKAAHNTKGKCPSCKKKIVFKAINKAKYYKDTEIVSIMQKIKKNQYVIRYFKVMKIFKNGDDTRNFPNEVLDTLVDPEFSIWEGSREIFTIQKNGKTKHEAVEELWDWKIGECEWKKERKRGMYFNKELLRDSRPLMYKCNLKRLLKNTKWKYSGLDHFKGNYMNMGDYIATYEACPAIEMLSKIKANTLLIDIIDSYVVWGSSTFGYIDMREKFLGCDKKAFQRAVKLNIPARKVEFLVILEELNYKLTDDQVMWAIKYTHTETFTQLLKFTSANKVISYLEKQVRASSLKNAAPVYFATTWRDYLHQCEELNLDLKKSYFLFPNNLEMRHKEYTESIKAKRQVKIDKGIIKTYNAWKELDYKEGPYKIVVARNQSMIIAEGSFMGHCVGGTTYTRGMANGDKIILMLRKNNKPYSTIELNPRTFELVQIHGKNYQLPPDAVKFANKWLKKHVEKIKRKKLNEKITKTIMPGMSVAAGGMYHERIAN